MTTNNLHKICPDLAPGFEWQITRYHGPGFLGTLKLVDHNPLLPRTLVAFDVAVPTGTCDASQAVRATAEDLLHQYPYARRTESSDYVQWLQEEAE